ncbi:MAG: hypothetical protein IMY77_04740 [Chloroflexi bacterium]|nr:hypothetical protein [Chloroflexota bacterium]
MKSPLGQKKWHLSLVALILCTILGSSCGLLNNDPVISSLETTEDRVTVSGSCEVRCVAFDADDDSLTYTWSATGGIFSAPGPITTWTAPDETGTYVITATVTDGRGGEVVRQLPIDVVVNRPPVIERLTAERLVANPDESIVIACAASDADGDNLTYAWSATGGTFPAPGSIVAWMAPAKTGTYVITVTVTDGRDGEITGQLSIDVLVNHSPIIERLTPEHSVVSEGKSTPIECVASDPDEDELSYLWTATGGDISGEGSAVIWTAPNTCESYVVTVTVIDARGGEASKELSLKVKAPG